MTEKHLVKRPRGRPPQHGLYSKKAMLELTVDKRNMILDLIRGERIPIGKPDMVMVETLARVLCKVDMIDRHFQEHGFFEDEAAGTPKAIFKPYLALLNRLIRLCNDLGMTPTARAALSRNVAEALTDFASAVQDAARLKEEENGEASGTNAATTP